jgi:hypothetical protein
MNAENPKSFSTIPGFILEKMLLPGCARILSDGGFSLKIVNAIAPLKIIKHHDEQYKNDISILIDDIAYDIDDFIVSYQGVKTPYYNLDPLHGFVVNMDDQMEIIYNGSNELKPGLHTVDIQLNIANPVRIKFATKFNESIL